MRIIMKSFVILTLLMVALTLSVMGKEQGDKAKPQQQSLYKGAGTPIYALLNINNFTSWVRYDGPGNLAPSGDNQGVYPRGTGNVIYLDGIYVGAKCYTDAAKTISAPRQLVRIGGKAYGFGLRPGKVNGSGATAVRMDPNDATVRIYRVRRDYASMSTDELKRDAAEMNEVPIANVTDAQIAAIKAQYEKDWKEWPVSYGAPYVDRNHNGKYDAPPPFSDTFTVDSLITQNRDEPGVSGADPNSPADQVIWTVANDLDVAQTLGFNSSEPMGLELQFTIWGYKRSDALGNLYFKRARIINKGGVEIDDAKHLGSFYLDSVYVSNFSDIDLGAFSDDLCGCDTTLSMSFVYNGGPIDLTFQKYGLPPPACGYDFLAGPMVKSVGDSAVFDLKRKYNWKNLPMTAFYYFSAGSPYSDPCNRETAGYLCNTGQWWKMLRGFAPIGTLQTADIPFANGPFPVSYFPLSGDPVTGKGFVDGLGTDYSFPPGDRRIGASSGPFTLAPGDTQDVVVGVVAGMGADRLSSVAVMKFNDRFVQNTFDALFQVPRPPKSPNVAVTQLDGDVVLDWGSDATRTGDIENTVSQPGAYKFEGYVVYQLPSRSSRLSAAKRVATYDLPTDPTVVLDQQFDQGSGQILSIPVEYGSNSGIRRTFDFKRDYIKDIDKIYNGQEYYLAVTAYSVATVPGYLPAALESTPVVLTVIGQKPGVGVRVNSAYGDSILPAHVSGVASASWGINIVNPMAVTGDTYEVRSVQGAPLKIILSSGDTLKAFDNKYQLVDVTKGGKVVIAANQNFGIDPSNIVLPDGFQFGMKAAPYYVEGEEIADYTLPSNWAGVNQALPYIGGSGFFPGNLLPFQVTKSIEIDFLGTPKSGVQGQKAYDFLRTTGSGASVCIGFFMQPFTVWDITDPAKKRQIDLGFMDAFGTTTYDSVWAPGTASGAREYWFVIDQDYTPTAKAVYTGLTVNGLAALPVLYEGWHTASAPAYKAGDKVIIHVTVPLGTNDVWRFTTADRAQTYNADLVKTDANRVGVYPNPYYAFNPAETNRFNRFVTFNNLPPKATIRIFNLAGHLVRRIDKDDQTKFARWDLTNTSLYPVASGVYICYVDMPDIGTTKIVKLAVIQEQEILDSY